MTFIWTRIGTGSAIFLTALGFCLAASGQEKPAATATSATVTPFNRNYQHDNQHKLRAGDKISFRIEEDLDEAKPLLVTDSGEVEFPYIGRVVAANKTCKDLAEELKSRLEKEYYYQATVQVGLDAINKVRGQAYVMGQVQKIGTVNIPVDEKLTVTKAILQCGGPGAWANLKEIKVIRKNGKDTETKVVNMNDVMIGKANDIDLEPEDKIFVPERKIKFN